MNSVFKWKLHKFIHSAMLPVMIAAGLVCGVAYIFIARNDGFSNGVEFMHGSAAFASSLLVLTAGIVCGISINSDMNTRQTSVAIMAGASRSSVCFTEILFYLFPVMIFELICTVASFVTGSFITGTTGIESVQNALFQTAWLLVYIFVCASCFAICVPLAFVMKKEAVCVAACFGVIMICYSVVESLFQMETPGEHLITVLQFFAYGQIFICAACESVTGLIIAFAVAAATLALISGVSCIIFKRMELK